MTTNNGIASKGRYMKWFDKYIAPKYKNHEKVFLTSLDCYNFRCSLLHQGSTQHPKSIYSRILFVEPSVKGIVLHSNIINNALNIDVSIFCRDIISGVEEWLKDNEETDIYKKNHSKFMKRYSEGLSPYIVGVPVIG